MKRLLREPLLHFLLLGSVLLLVHRLVAPPAGTARRVVVDAQVAAGLVRDFERRAGRSPEEPERRALIDRYVESELLYREALALGLDRGDVVVRRRLVQKMELLAGAGGEPLQPTEDELRAELAAHPSRYGRPGRLALRHVFVSHDRHGDAAAEAARLRALIDAGSDPAALGDPFLRGAQLGPSSESEIAGVFGAGFAARVQALPEGQWSPPLPSSFGLHLVRVEAREPSRPAALDEVRDRVVEAVRERRREEALARAVARLRTRYGVEIAPEALATTERAGSSVDGTRLAERSR